MEPMTYPPGLGEALEFPLVQALLGRRARRFPVGACIPDGVLAYSSKKEPLPLSELEQMMVLMAAGGNTGWHYMIMRHARYAPYLSNYSAAAGGRTFPSAAGIHTSELFFTNDEGVFKLETRDAPALAQRDEHGEFDLEQLLEAHRARIRKIEDGRLRLPQAEPYMEGHNTWCVNCPGTLLVIPVADIAQHQIAALCYYIQNGYGIYDDINNTPIPGLDKYRHLVNLDEPLPLSRFEQDSLAECCAELSASCYAGVLMLQAMGLGGWMFDGIDRYAVLGASGDPDVPGLGFRYDTDPRWALPNPTGREGVFEGFCPPHYPDMRAAIEALVRRKFGPGGPFHPDTPGPWRDTPLVRRSAQVYSEEFKDCATLIAQYIYDRFGKFPGTVPSMYTLMYLQAHHLDLDFYDKFFQPGAYLKTHADHMAHWH